MNIFETELKNGRFLVGQCIKCNKVTWPPNDFCSFCFGELRWRQIKEPGILIEYSAKDGKQFCLAEFEESIRVMGTISSSNDIKTGQKVRITSCGFDRSPKFTFEVI